MPVELTARAAVQREHEYSLSCLIQDYKFLKYLHVYTCKFGLNSYGFILEWNGEPTQGVNTLCVKLDKKKEKENTKLSGIAALVASKRQPPVEYKPSSSRQVKPGLNASNGSWTWQSALTTDGPTGAISDQEGAFFPSQNSPLENVLLPAPSVLNWRDLAYVHGFNKMKQNKNQLAFDSKE